MQVAVQIGRRAKALDQSERAGVGCATFEPRLPGQKACDDPVDDAQQAKIVEALIDGIISNLG